MDFKKARKGYDPKQVDEFIKHQSMEHEAAGAEQRDRIFELKARVAQLEKENGDLKGREADVSRALLSAVQKSNEMEDMAKKKYDLEIQRLKLFHIKWQAYFDDIIDRYPINDELKSVAEFDGEMREILRTPPSDRAKAVPPKPNFKATDAAAQHDREKRRLAGKNKKNPETDEEYGEDAGTLEPIKAIRKYLDGNAGSGAAPAFTMEEQLNPTEDLADILKELGIE